MRSSCMGGSERLTANANVTTAGQGSVPASTDTVKSEGRWSSVVYSTHEHQTNMDGSKKVPTEKKNLFSILMWFAAPGKFIFN